MTETGIMTAKIAGVSSGNNRAIIRTLYEQQEYGI
jgi:hypothetical protein